MSESAAPVRRPVPVGIIAVALWTVLLSGFVILGADLLWVVAVGDTIRADGAVPSGIPFASAPQVGWHNPVVLAELFLSVVHQTGHAGLAALQLAVVTTTLLVLVAESRRLGGSELQTAIIISLTVVGLSSALVVTRLPSLSLVPFVLAIAVLRRQHDQPSRAVWWLVPLYVVWGNLHGGVLVGLAVLGVFLIISPAGGSWPRRLGVGVGCALALLLTSAGTGTPAYYLRVLGNEAAVRGTDLWARPNPAHPLDLAAIIVALILLVLFVRRRPPLWELLVALGLAIGFVSAARNGIWLILFLAPAAFRRPDRQAYLPPTPAWWGFIAATVVVAVVASAWQLERRDDEIGPPGASVVPLVRTVADGRPVLADEPLAETLAQAGVRVWAANPIDAFEREVQGGYLDFLHDAHVPPQAEVDVVVVGETRARAVLETGGWREVTRQDGYAVLIRDP